MEEIRKAKNHSMIYLTKSLKHDSIITVTVHKYFMTRNSLKCLGDLMRNYSRKFRVLLAGC